MPPHDYSALRPVESLTTDKINLDPARGQSEPAGLPQNTDGLGLRFMGVVAVAGEGIFKWSVQSKDGVRLNIDDKTLIENDGVHEAASHARPSSSVGEHAACPAPSQASVGALLLDACLRGAAHRASQ